MSRYIDIEPYEKDGWYLQKHYHNSYGEVIKTTPLISVPTADAEPIKYAHWIGVDDFPHETWECDRCGKIIETDEPPRYCENCGAKMYEIILCRDKKDEQKNEVKNGD